MTKEERSAFCSADKGNPYPPCWNPNHKCEDCKREYEIRKRRREYFNELLNITHKRLNPESEEPSPTENYFS